MVGTMQRCGFTDGRYSTWHVQSCLPMKEEIPGVCLITCSKSRRCCHDICYLIQKIGIGGFEECMKKAYSQCNWQLSRLTSLPVIRDPNATHSEPAHMPICSKFFRCPN